MKIGFIGLGLMGGAMAGRLRAAGYDLVVSDLSRQAAAPLLQAGATWADTPLALAQACDVVFTSLPKPADVETVAFGSEGLATGLRHGAAWFDLSTNGVSVVRKLHETLAAKGVHFLDAPVSGGPAGAASGRLALWVGGERDVFDQHVGVLRSIGDQVQYIGSIGAGTVAKLVNNMASMALNAAMTEVFTLGVKAGVEPLTLWEAIRQGVAGRQRTFDLFGSRVLPGRFDPPNLQLGLAQKDVALAVQLGRELNVPVRLCGLVLDEVTEAVNRGWGGRDSQAFTLLQQERAGIQPFAVPVDQIKAIQEASATS